MATVVLTLVLVLSLGSAWASGPIALWHFDGNLRDAADAHDGAVGVGSIPFVAGASGQAAHFDDSSYIVVPDDPDLSAMPELAIECWVRLDPAGMGQLNPIINKFGSGPTDDDEWVFGINAAGYPYMVTSSPTASYELTAATPLSPDAWHHVAAVFSNTLEVMEIHIDGALDASAYAYHPSFRDTDQPVQIGGFKYSSADPWEYFHGRIDELTVHQALPAWLEDDDPDLAYTGTWTQLDYPSASAGHLTYSGQTGAKVDLEFEGTGLRWMVQVGPIAGMADIYFDGAYRGTVDLYRPAYGLAVLEKTGLPYGWHGIRIQVTGQKNLRSQGYFIDIDAFQVLP